jgi:hypothetical protein
MPNKTYKPNEFACDRGWRSKLIRQFGRVLGLIALYFGITFSLDCLDSTPRWAHISFPSELVYGEPVISPVDMPDLSPDGEMARHSSWQVLFLDALEHGYWAKHRGDPTVLGWGITILYGLAALTCLYCTGLLDTKRSPPISELHAWFWWMIVVILVLVGVNKQLDLQMLLADIGRTYSKSQGWYDQRRPIQIRVLALGACVGMAGLLRVGYKLKRAPKSTWFALWGVIFLGVNILIHMVSLHSIEHLLMSSGMGVSIENALEIMTLVWIIISAMIFNHTQREHSKYIMR